MDNENIVKLVTAEVLRQLTMNGRSLTEKQAMPQQKAVVVFTGGTIGLKDGLAEVKKLQELNFALTIVLSAAAEQIIGSECIQRELGSHITIVTAQSAYPREFLREMDILLVPVLTQNTAARLAYTLADTMVSTLIMQALMMGKPVIAASNAADPLDSWRVQSNMGKPSSGLLQALRTNLQKIESYGIQLMDVQCLAAEAQKLLNRQAAIAKPSSAVKKTVLDASSIKIAAGNGEKSILIPCGTIITPLARDIARDYGIELVEQDNA